MPLPEITHFQFLVLDALSDGVEMSGKMLRAEIATRGTNKSGPSFYQFMNRLEEGNFVLGRYEQKIVESQIIKERTYRITGDGLKARKSVLEFYEEQARIKAASQGSPKTGKIKKGFMGL